VSGIEFFRKIISVPPLVYLVNGQSPPNSVRLIGFYHFLFHNSLICKAVFLRRGKKKWLEKEAFRKILEIIIHFSCFSAVCLKKILSRNVCAALVLSLYTTTVAGYIILFIGTDKFIKTDGVIFNKLICKKFYYERRNYKRDL
jgi:hypothetical protein